MLKPISKDELEKAVAVSLERIREHVAQEQNRSLIQQGYELAIPRMREELLRNLIEKPYREDQVLRVHHKLKQLNLEWLLPGDLRLIMFGVDSLRALTGAEGPEDKDALLGMLGEKLDLLFKEWQLDRYALFHSKEDAWVALVEDGEGMEGILDRLAKEACLRIGEELGIRLNWGAASTTGSLPRLHDLYRRALDSLVYLKVYGRTDADELEDDLQINLEVRLDNPKELVEILKYGTEHDIQETMEGFPGSSNRGTFNIRAIFSRRRLNGCWSCFEPRTGPGGTIRRGRRIRSCSGSTSSASIRWSPCRSRQRSGCSRRPRA
ncbi:hypothetical protein N6H14_16110 [Paenibacillus sp. CC-CFT747]|nr:hypothetical protein N6H14_16110 [Paenibacillus sp. CC-CFT747]